MIRCLGYILLLRKSRRTIPVLTLRIERGDKEQGQGDMIDLFPSFSVHILRYVLCPTLNRRRASNQPIEIVDHLQSRESTPNLENAIYAPSLRLRVCIDGASEMS